MNIFLKNLFLLSLVVTGLAGCRFGGGLNQESTSLSSPPPVVTTVTLLMPATSPFYSSASSLIISGFCPTGDTLTLSGAASQIQTCTATMFSFTVTATSDGPHQYFITPSSSNGSPAAPVGVVWIRKTSVSRPVIVTPATNPFLSAQSALTISGSCETSSIVRVLLLGVTQNQMSCENSTFNFSIPALVDGNYNYSITQQDLAGNLNSTSLVWQKAVLSALPASAAIAVRQPQVLTFSGGSGNYTVAIATNNSGGSYNSTTRTYTPGPLAGVSDILLVSDGLGATATVTFMTTPGPADHLVLVSGNNQAASIGTALPLPLIVRVVDQDSNPISNFPVYFRVLSGDANLNLSGSSALPMTNASGEAQVNVRLSAVATKTMIDVAPLGASLPDLALTGKTRESFTVNGTTTNSLSRPIGALTNVGSNPVQVVTADFNLDNIEDAAVLNSGFSSSTISILIGRGNGLFAPPTTISGLCADALSLQAGILRSSSLFTDLVISCSTSSTVAMQVMLGLGNGNFAARANVALVPAIENSPGPLALGDFDKNGILDVATTMLGYETVSVRLGNGNGTFGAPVQHDLEGPASDIVTGDFNGDSHLDLAVSNYYDTFNVLFNTGGGVTNVNSFATQPGIYSGNYAISIVSGNFNNDTLLDIAILNSGEQTVRVFENQGAGIFDFSSSMIFTTGGIATNPTSLKTLDLNADGLLDFVILNNGDSTVAVSYQSAVDPFFVVDKTFEVAGNPTGLAVKDINQDTRPDLLIAAGSGIPYQLQVLPGQANQIFGYVTDLTIASPIMAVLDDFDGDGRTDAGVLQNDKIALYQGSGNGFFVPTTVLNTGSASVKIILADLRGNGRKDMIAINNNVRIFLSNGNGTFGVANNANTTLTPGSKPLDVAVSDFDKDGFLDLAVIKNLSSSVIIYYGNGDGTFKIFTRTYTTGFEPMTITKSDLNNDKIMDLAIANTDESVDVFFGNLDGSFQARVNYPGIAGGPNSIFAYDFNNDSFVDLLVTDGLNGIVVVLRGQSGGVFDGSNPIPFPAGTNPDGIVTGDFNADQRLDLVVTNLNSNQFTIFTGSGGFPSPEPARRTVVGSSFLLAKSLAAADINSDGRLDLLVLDEGSNQMQVLFGQ